MAQWWELRLEVNAADAGLVGEQLIALGAQGVLEDYREGEAPLPQQPWDTAPRVEPEVRVLRTWWQDREGIAAHFPNLELSWNRADDADWADWRKAFKRRVIDPQLAIAPPWDQKPGDLIIEPGLAFGNGDHPTTRMCLERMQQLPPAERCLDVGSGSGILALAAARRGSEVTGIDIDPVAVSTAQENAERNGLKGTFSTLPLQKVDGTYDLVVANLYAELLVELAPHLKRITHQDLLLTGVLADRAALVTEAFADVATVVRWDQEGWVLFHLTAQ